MAYWLFKTEPNEFSIDDLAACCAEPWNGIRNYQARNFLRDTVAVGDLVFIYHSSCKQPGVVGVAEVMRGAYLDPTQFDIASKYYDAQAQPNNPRWYCVDIRFSEKFSQLVSLTRIKAQSQLRNMVLVKRSRLSIQPVSAQEWQIIKRLASEEVDG